MVSYCFDRPVFCSPRVVAAILPITSVRSPRCLFALCLKCLCCCLCLWPFLFWDSTIGRAHNTRCVHQAKTLVRVRRWQLIMDTIVDQRVDADLLISMQSSFPFLLLFLWPLWPRVRSQPSQPRSHPAPTTFHPRRRSSCCASQVW